MIDSALHDVDFCWLCVGLDGGYYCKGYYWFNAIGKLN